MEVICINPPNTIIITKFIIGKKYTCFIKNTSPDSINYYVFDELNNVVTVSFDYFIPIDEYRDEKINMYLYD